MCQLTYISTNHTINKALLYSQLKVNTVTYHQDGTGFFQIGSPIFKSKSKPADIKDLYATIANNIKPGLPIIAHVRLTTFKGKVSDANSHPFETDKLVLAHNGTLVPNTGAIDLTKYTDLIDSEVFLKELSEVYNGKNFVKAVNMTMNKFTGPFAFLIYSKLENRYFAVKGKTKTLFISALFTNDTKIGYIINTEKNDLLISLNNLHVNTKLLCNYTMFYSEPAALADNSIYELKDSSTRLIGSVTEDEPIRPPVYNYWKGERVHEASKLPTKFSTVDKPRYIYQPLIDFMDLTRLSLEELDLIMYRTIGIPLASANDSDLGTFCEYILPALKANATRRKADVWIDIKLNSKLSTGEIYSKYKLKFPYFINKTSRLENIYYELRKVK